MDDAQVLFLWAERVKSDRIKVWFDPHGVLHFHTVGHPGLSMTPPRIGTETPVVPV
jgi:hypothetical protein